MSLTSAAKLPVTASEPSNGIVMLEDDFVNAIALPVVDREIYFSTLFEP